MDHMKMFNTLKSFLWPWAYIKKYTRERDRYYELAAEHGALHQLYGALVSRHKEAVEKLYQRHPISKMNFLAKPPYFETKEAGLEDEISYNLYNRLNLRFPAFEIYGSYLPSITNEFSHKMIKQEMIETATEHVMERIRLYFDEVEKKDNK